MKRTALFLIAFLLCLCIQAQHRSEQEAIQIAQEFFAKQQMNKVPRLSVVPQQKVSQQIQRRVASARKTPNKNQSFYVVNDKENNRFVIVSADERLYKILGYSENGCFEPEYAPEGLMELMVGYNTEYNYVINHPQTSFSSSPQKESVNPIAPLIKSKWGQRSPFNYHCPLSSAGSKSVSGCVATAMAQLLNYYGNPSQGQGGLESYTTSTTKTAEKMNFDTLTIDWNNIKDTYRYYYDENGIYQSVSSRTALENNEVAKLMHACGVSVFMDYNTSSGAFPSDVPYALINHFGYNPSIVCVRRECYSNEEWNNMIIEELNVGRPVLYGGQDGEYGGHEFIIDGINDDGLYHFNFGWYGDDDGYFSIDAIDPDIYKFHLDHDMVIRITPQFVEGERDNIYFNQFGLKSTVNVGDSYKINLSFKLYSNQINSQNFNFDGNVGVGVFDKNWNLINKLYEFDADKLDDYNKLLMQPQYVHWPDFFDDSGLLESLIEFDESIFGKDDTQLYVAPYAIIKSKVVLGRSLGGEKNWYRATTKDGKVILEPDSVIKGYIPPIPPVKYDTIPDWLVGTYEVSALDDINQKTSVWQVTVLKDEVDPTKCLFYNVDKMLIDKGYSAAINKVSGYMCKDGKIRIPANQNIDNDYWLRNYLSTDSIHVEISRVNSSMSIREAWGVSNKSTGDILSRYTSTDFMMILPDTIATPIIDVDEQNRMTINCATKGVVVKYTYTRHGEEPTDNSIIYNGRVTLNKNGVVKAVAIKDEKKSSVATFKVNTITVTKPVIHEAEDGKTITIDNFTPFSTVYYTTNGKRPSSTTGIKYESPFECNVTTWIQAIAIREDWNDSPIDSVYHIVPDTVYTVIANNIAGELPSRIPTEKKMEIQALRISGSLNGTDIKFIREMIIEGNLASLDMELTSIVEGGDEYYTPTVGFGEKTSNDIIGHNMFDNCKGLISLKLPSSIITIDSWAFVNCDGLKTLIIPKSCQTVKDYAIYSANNLETVCLSPNTQEFSGNNFTYCPNLKSFSVAEGNIYFKAIDGILYKDNQILVKYPCAKENSIFIIPDGITIIGSYAFENAKFENITITEGVVSIEESAFSSCSNLTGISLPNSVLEVGRWCFNGCKNLIYATLSDNLSTISSYLFYGCQNLQEFFIGSQVVKIEPSSFEGCISLQAFSVSKDNLYYVSIGGIIYTKDLKKLKRCPLALYSEELLLPEGLEEIEEDAFNGCANLQKVQMPTSLKHIGRSAFSGSSISTVGNFDNVNMIDSWAFAGTKNLETFVVPENVSVVNDYTFYYCEKLGFVYLPTKIRKFGNDAFYGCESLTFIDSKIEDIDSVMVDYSSYLEAYTSFGNIPDTCTWRVPCGTSEKYKAQPWWVSTWRIIESPCVISGVTNNSGVRWTNGKPTISLNTDEYIQIYNTSGVLVQIIKAKSGEQYQIDLPRGMYIINNKKIVIK